MAIDFFCEAYASSSNRARFGLCDDVAPVNSPKNPAYIDEEDDSKWTAVVNNVSQKTIWFHPIDNCIEILRSNGDMDSRCDGLLRDNRDLLFVELKDRARAKWIGEGLNQLKITIRNFKRFHNIDDFGSIRAHICNKQRPLAVVSCKVALEQFRHDTGYSVSVDRNITI